jgi:putative ABC transport system ATP-binding protein
MKRVRPILHHRMSDLHQHHPSPTQRLRGWLRTESTELWVAVIYSVAIGLLSLVVPVAVQSVVNTIAFGTLLQPLLYLTLAVLAGLGFSAVLQAVRTYVVEMMQRRIFVRVSTNSLSRLLRARVEAFDDHHGPELVNRFLDVVTVQKAGAILLLDGLTIFMQTVMGMILLAVYHPWLLAFDLVLLVCILLILFPMGRGAIPTSVKESKAKYALVAWLEEVARWQTTFKSTRGAFYAVERTDALVGEYLSYRAKHFRILLRQISASLILHALASSALLGVGGLLVINRQLTLGQLIAAELVVTVVVSGFAKFGKQLETFYDLNAAVDKLGYITDLPLEPNGSDPLPSVERGASIRLREVEFTYANGRQVLTGVDLDLLPGARIGISGYGKSTLLDLIFGLRTPTGGTIEVDGHDVREIRLDHLRSQISMVRAPEVFHGTIADNLKLGNEKASAVDLRNALEVAGLLGDVQSLPEATLTELQTGGLPLSPSQGIRLMVARAVLQEPRVLLLDEALDQVESPDARVALARALFRELPGSTTMVVTSKPEILELCDEVYELLDGRLKKHSKLVSQ